MSQVLSRPALFVYPVRSCLSCPFLVFPHALAAVFLAGTMYEVYTRCLVKKRTSCEMEGFVETYLCRPRVTRMILRSHVLVQVLYDLMKGVYVTAILFFCHRKPWVIITCGPRRSAVLPKPFSTGMAYHHCRRRASSPFHGGHCQL